jgi:metallophosphoesterase superfamily enzyme
MGLRRPAFLIGARHLILPAFGRFTGGLDATDPVLAPLIGRGLAVLTGERPLALPWPIPAARHRRGI